VERCGVRVTNFGMIDKAQDAYAVLPRLKAANLDLVFCDMLTYATSATFGAVIRNLDVPLVLVALQPLAALDYARATTQMQLANDDFCSVPEFAGVAIRMGRRPPPVILGTLNGDPQADAEIADWCDVAMALHDVKVARIGHFGHPIEHMLDMQTDQTALTGAFGCHVVQTEADDLLQMERAVTAAEVDRKTADILSLFDTPDPGADPVTEKLTADDLAAAARAAAALDRFVDHHALDGLAYYYEGEPGSPLRALVTNLVVGNSLLTAAGFPIDFSEGFVLVGHDGPHHINIAAGKPVLRSLRKYHGKPGRGASVEFKIREGPITMLSVSVTAHGRFKFVLAQGQSVAGEIPATGNTNTRGFFEPDVRTFLKRWVAEGPTHHFALGSGLPTRSASTASSFNSELRCDTRFWPA
jgi:L-arabinose isomerase